ncbi:MAG: HPr(Ser) kinase/phosphatase [Elusimicrobia bacterium]|nr:HPr(Ser) kinase/phosphatase [Candidatus Obscuribacterium magneticum]
MPELTIKEVFEACARELKLEWAAAPNGGGKVIRVSEINRPGLSLAGYFEYFRPERIQIFGLGECSYLQTLDSARRMDMIGRVFGTPELPGAIVTHGREVMPEMMEQATRNNVPIFRSGLTTAHVIRELSAYLEKRLAPTVRMHGVLTVVYGLGVLIVGESGIGKSECGLELVKRGHILVCDDAVEIRRLPGDILIGASSPVVEHYMEVRGLGIIDVKQVFGVSSVKDSARIELVVRLEPETGIDDYDRVGLEGHNTEILGVQLPEVRLPLRPGRNVAVLLEVAALNERLKQEGVFSARELNQKLIEKMKQSAAKKAAP